MKTGIITIAVASLCVFGSVSAEAAASKQENVGVGTGAIVGAVAGGPAGFFVGAIAGALIGERMHKREEQVNELARSLDESNEARESLELRLLAKEASMQSLDAQIAQLRAAPAANALALLQAGIEIDIPFRTDVVDAEAEFRDRITRFSKELAGIAGVKVSLDGYADPRGTVAYNQELSLKRAESVRELLLMGGLNTDQVSVTGHGSVVTDDVTDADRLALERRVNVRIFMEEADADRQLAGL